MKMSIIRPDPVSIEIPKKPANKSAAEHRRATKPIMEKRRRARINNSLEQLKTLILEAHNKDPAKYSKLEKADILEMTVQFLKTIQKKVTLDESTVIHHFKDGYDECAHQVKRFVDIAPDMDINMKSRIKNHLSTTLSSFNNLVSSTTSSPSLPSSPLNMKTSDNQQQQQPLTTIPTNMHSIKCEPDLTTPPPSADSLHFAFTFPPIMFHHNQVNYCNTSPISPYSQAEDDDDMSCTPVDCSKSSKLIIEDDNSVWRPW